MGKRKTKKRVAQKPKSKLARKAKSKLAQKAKSKLVQETQLELAQKSQLDLVQKPELNLKKQMIIRIYQFLRDEYNFIKLHNVDNCKLSPLSGLANRTARATGLSPGYVSRICGPYKNSPVSLPLLPTSNVLSYESLIPPEYNDETIIPDLRIAKPIIKEETIDGDSFNDVISIKRETLDTALERPDIQEETSCMDQDILHIKQEALDESQNNLLIKKEMSGIEEETPFLKQEILNIELDAPEDKKILVPSCHNKRETTREIDFENEINVNILLPDELKTEKPSSSKTPSSGKKEKILYVEFLRKRGGKI